MRITELTPILRNAAKAGAEKALAQCGALPGGVTKADAYRLYGRGNVDRWLREGLLEVSNKNLDRVKLERVAAASNRRTYLPVTER
jgi:hypothetical protein